MECMLIPNDPAGRMARVPFVCNSHYDGKEWLSYPARMGVSRMVEDQNNPYALPYEITEWSQPAPTNEQESFYQTWLFFGLISEALGGNSRDTDTTLAGADCGSSAVPPGSPILRSIYNNYVVTEGEAKYVTTTSLLLDLQQSWSLSPLNDSDDLTRRCKGLRQCLTKARVVFNVTSIDFDPRIKQSIAAIAEILTQTTIDMAASLNFDVGGHLLWGKQPYRGGLPGSPNKEAMKGLGWCPSEISRCKNKFSTFQLHYFLSMLDNSTPYRDHRACDDVRCRAYTIDATAYKVGHVNEGCNCEVLPVDTVKVARVLSKAGCVPLLRFVGDVTDLKVDVLRSAENTPYVAISHVWADGLGNQTANALHPCQLIRLRTLVQDLDFTTAFEMNSRSAASTQDIPLIWIDTLCCPVGPPPLKQLSLEKMPQVYRDATSVLVLDAGLQAYESQSMDPVEKLARVMTAGWLRRLWTLQEGALARVLYFQFKDEAISLESLKSQSLEASKDLRYRIISYDFLNVYQELKQFFHARDLGQSGPTLNTLSKALLNRGVSVPSDEAICIGTLMSLPIREIVKPSHNPRMQRVWSLLASKMGGIPSDIIFFEDERLDIPGWRWAPASLLTMSSQLYGPESRLVRWKDTQLGISTSRGLNVRYPGFRLHARQFEDNRPRNPWPNDHRRLPEMAVIFRDESSKRWYQAGVKEYASFTTKEREVYNALKLFTLHDMVMEGNCWILMQKKGSMTSEYVPFGAETTSQLPVQGLIVSLDEGKKPITTRFFDYFKCQKSAEEVLTVRSAKQILIGPVNNVENTFYDALQACAIQLRLDPIVDKLKAVTDKEGIEYQNLYQGLRRKMEEMVKTILDGDRELSAAVEIQYGAGTPYLWVLIANWFYHDFVGARLPDDQVWCVG